MSQPDKLLSPQESLQVIRAMIETTKNVYSDHSHYFLLWGWATFIGCGMQYILLAIVHYRYHYYAWFVTPLALFIHLYFLYNYERKAVVKTFINDAVGYVWQIVGFGFLSLSVVFFFIGWQNCFPFYILLYGIGTFVTGSLIRFKPMKYAGVFCLFLVMLTPTLAYSYQILMCAFAILISYIVPGHLLRHRYKKNNR